MFCNFTLYIFHLFLWLYIPAVVMGFIPTSTCHDASSCTGAIDGYRCSSQYHFIYYRNKGNLFHHHADALLAMKHASTPFVSSISFLYSSSRLHMNHLYNHHERREIRKKLPPSTSSSMSAGRDFSLNMISTTTSTTIPWSWNAESSTTQLYARGGGKKRSRNSKNKASKEETTSSTTQEEEETKSTFIPKTNRQLNRKERMEILLSQHGPQCTWCHTPLTISTATTDHIIPKIKGGPSWIENELASCSKCNKARGHIPALDYLQIMKEKGFVSNQDAIIQKLHELHFAIEDRGGQRKARPHLYRQLRRLDRI